MGCVSDITGFRRLCATGWDRNRNRSFARCATVNVRIHGQGRSENRVFHLRSCLRSLHLNMFYNEKSFLALQPQTSSGLKPWHPLLEPFQIPCSGVPGVRREFVGHSKVFDQNRLFGALTKYMATVGGLAA